MSDEPETPSNSRNSHENVGAKKADANVASKFRSLHISETTKPLTSTRALYKTTRNNSRGATEFHKHVCKLAWKYLACIDKSSISHIEIEMKFGVITDKRTHRRMTPHNKPFIVQNRNGRLVSNVPEQMFSSFQELLRSKSENPSKCAPRVVKQVQKYTKDSIYNCNNASKVGKLTSWRCSEDLRNKELKLTYIKKVRVKDFLIRYPQSSLDAKISISLEVPEYETSAAFRNGFILQRTKSRSTYTFNDKMPLHLDLTKVTTTRRNSHQYTSHEVEVEMDPIFKETISANDREKFNEYMCSFLNASDLIREAAERDNMLTT